MFLKPLPLASRKLARCPISVGTGNAFFIDLTGSAEPAKAFLPCPVFIDFATKGFMMIANATTGMGSLHLCGARVRVNRGRRGGIPVPLRRKDVQGLA